MGNRSAGRRFRGLSVSGDLAASSGPSTDAVHTLLGRYFDGLFRSDAELLATVFHPSAIYATASEGSLTHLTMDHYLPLVAARESPASRGETRTDAVESIQFAGTDTALARVRCSIGPRRFIDLLSLLSVDGRWQIIAKVFHVDLAEPASCGGE